MAQQHANNVRPRRHAAAAAAGILIAAVASVGLTAPAAYAQTVPDPDLTSYVLFGFEELDFKGGQGNHGPSIIDGGNIGVNGTGFIRGNDFRMNLCANAQMVMSDDTMVVSDTLRLGDSSTPTQECDVFEVFNNIPAANNETSRTGPALPFQPPPVKAAPPFPDFDCDPGNPFTVTNGQTATMAPGVYGDVNFQNGSTVNMQPGTYTFCRLTTGQNVTVNTPPGVTFQAVEDFLFNDGMDFDGDDCDTIPLVYVRGDDLGASANAVRFGQDSEVWGHFYTPTGRLNLGNQTALHGTFWARAIGSDFNVDVEYCPPPHEEPDTGTVSVTKELTGELDGAPPPAAEYTIHYDCTIPALGLRDALDQELVISAGETITFTDVQIGTTCTVTEVETPPPLPGYVFDPPVFTPSDTITIDSAGQTVTMLVENPLREIFGTLEVTKTVTGDTAGQVPGSEFGFTLDCAGDEFDTAFTLADGATFTSDPIRVGVECTVTEDDVPDPAPGFLYDPPVFDPAPPTVTITEEDQVVTVGVENELVEQVGRFEVTKVFSGDTEGIIDGSVFGFSLDCDDDTFDTTFELDPDVDDTFLSEQMPVGTTCTLAETSVPPAHPGFTYEDPIYSPDPPTARIGKADETVTMRVDNPLTGPPPSTGPGPNVAGPDGPGPIANMLPHTGGPSRWLGAGGVALVLVGGLLIVASRPT